MGFKGQGPSQLPRSAYLGYMEKTNGYATSYSSFFVRLERLGKSLSNRIMSMLSGVVDFEELKDMLAPIGVDCHGIVSHV
jgi:hypothetical protein